MQRMEEFYCHTMRGDGEGLNRPIRYGVWVLVGGSGLSRNDFPSDSSQSHSTKWKNSAPNSSTLGHRHT